MTSVHISTLQVKNATLRKIYIFFSQVSNATGQMTLTKLCDRGPFSQELLEKDDCFILDNGSNGKIYVWKGDSLKLFMIPSDT